MIDWDDTYGENYCNLSCFDTCTCGPSETDIGPWDY